MRTSYSIDYPKKAGEAAAVLPQGISSKPFKANFFVGNKDLPSDFTSTAVHFQNQCLELVGKEGCPRQAQHPPKQALTIGCRVGAGNGLVTCHQESFPGHKSLAEGYEPAKPIKIKALNVFDAPICQADPNAQSQYRSEFGQTSQALAQARSKNPQGKESTTSHIIFEGNQCSYLSSTKDAFRVSESVGPALQGRPPARQAFSISQNKYKDLNVKVNRCRNDYSHIPVHVPTAAELRARSMAKQIPLGFSETTYVSNCMHEFSRRPAEVDQMIANQCHPDIDKKKWKSSLGMSLGADLQRPGHSLYHENFQPPQPVGVQRPAGFGSQQRTKMVIGTANNDWKSTFNT